MFYIVSHIPIVTLISPGDLDAMKYKSNSIENEELEHLHWSMNDKGDNILYNANIIECKRAIEGEDNFSMIFTNQPIPKVVDHFYFEVTVEDEGENGSIGVGLAKTSAKYQNGRMMAWDKGTIGDHGNNGGIFHNGHMVYICETYGKGDTIGCMMKKLMFDNYQYLYVNFFKNGKNLMPSRCIDEEDYYPTIGMGSAGAKVTSNLGETDFVYKIEGT